MQFDAQRIILIVIDGRAIYFSNFRAFEQDKSGFTRTFFVDFYLQAYQRGRLVRRLCEIATYRMSCVSDIELFHALQDGINTLNSQFNILVSKELKDPVEVKPVKEALEQALSLYQRAVEFDKYVTDGVVGRGHAIQGDWDRVKRQLADIREERLGGYAKLVDFLERGLAESVLEMQRIADRYENLLVRIRDYMSTIRTQLTATQALQLSDFMRSNERMARETETLTSKLTELTDKNVKLAQKMMRQTVQHTLLFKGAELLVWAGSLFYISGMLDGLILSPFESEINTLASHAAIKVGVRVVFIVIAFAIICWLYQRLTGKQMSMVWGSGYRNEGEHSSSTATGSDEDAPGGSDKQTDHERAKREHVE